MIDIMEDGSSSRAALSCPFFSLIVDLASSMRTSESTLSEVIRENISPIKDPAICLSSKVNSFRSLKISASVMSINRVSPTTE